MARGKQAYAHSVDCMPRGVKQRIRSRGTAAIRGMRAAQALQAPPWRGGAEERVKKYNVKWDWEGDRPCAYKVLHQVKGLVTASLYKAQLRRNNTHTTR